MWHGSGTESGDLSQHGNPGGEQGSKNRLSAKAELAAFFLERRAVLYTLFLEELRKLAGRETDDELRELETKVFFFDRQLEIPGCFEYRCGSISSWGGILALASSLKAM